MNDGLLGMPLAALVVLLVFLLDGGPGNLMGSLLLRFAATALAGVAIFIPRAIEGGKIDILRVCGQRIPNTRGQIGVCFIRHSEPPFVPCVLCRYYASARASLPGVTSCGG